MEGEIGMGILAVVCASILIVGVKLGLEKAQVVNRKVVFNRFAGFVVCWLVFVSIISITGLINDFSMPPKFLVILIVPMLSIYWWSRKSWLHEVLRNVPDQWLLYFQVFRIPVELLLWKLWMSGVVPIQMSFAGLNWDIFSGILGPVAAILITFLPPWRKSVLISYNVIGLLLLLNIVVVAMLSTPTPFRYFMNEPANRIVVQFPVVLLPAVLVPIAYLLHWFSLKQLLLKGRKEQQN